MSIENVDQIRASDPMNSVWVSASAGTGKTKVLIDRVLRLLLEITTPEKILCITFTKAAASEMQNRIHNVLQKWATCSEEKLKEDVTKLIQAEPDEDTLSKAKTLFAKTLETAGGMKIMTIHSFCQSVLKRFPLEAEIPPHFNVLDKLASNRIKEEILNEVLSGSDMVKNVEELTSFISSGALMGLLGRILEESTRLSALMEHYVGSVDTVIQNLKKHFNISKYDTEQQVIEEICPQEEWLALKNFYLTKKETVRDNKKKESKAYEVFDVNERLKAFKLVKATGMLLKLAFRVVEKYQAIKSENAFLDFADLIEKTNALLSKSTMTAWVLYKLDDGIDHILVDEAQDTNPSQWEIIKALCEEFFAGEGSSEKLRTLFVVGDKKQSIYSVQGADPRIFEKMHSLFEEHILASQNTFRDVDLNYSFRSTQPILRLVNYMLQNACAKDGVLLENETANHLLNRKNDAGLVEIWPVEETKKTDRPNPWKPPVEREENESAMKRLVDKIADKIQSMIGRDDLPSQNRKVKAGDILILLQKRTTLMNELVRALRKRQVPVAGLDKLLLSNHLAIQDLMALTEFVLQPKNNLNLANLVKSPLLGLEEEDLYKICVKRENISVWDRVQQLYPQTAKDLTEYMNMADKCPPFEFYSFVLGAMKGRQKFVARMGDEVNEALDEFLNLSLNFESDQTPSLQSFLNWFSTHPIEITRDLDNSSIDAVRLMTVHGSKGLQGNIVFLPDTRSTRVGNEEGGEFIWLDNLLPLWVPAVGDRPASLSDYFDDKAVLARQEKKRLLYVAVTRAKDRLYICGFGKGGANNWYDLIVDSLPEEIKPDADGIIRLVSQQTKTPKQEDDEKLPFDLEKVPNWATKMPSEETPQQNPLSPSKLDRSESDDFEPEESVLKPEQELAMRRGTFIHKMLQFLPSLPPEQRERYLQQNCPDGIDLPENLLKIFDHPDLKKLFGPESLAEVPVMGMSNGKMLSGQIDRLVVLPDEVKIIDFKTNRFVHKDSADAYKNQLNAYKDLLKTIFPDKMIKSYILWTQTLHFEEV